MNELALFAGNGGGILASKLLGIRTICGVEWDQHSIAVLLARQNDRILEAFPIWDDVCTFDGLKWRGYVDIISGGFPCQKFSSASRGRRVAKDLWPEMLRIILDVMPRFVFSENVSRKAIETAAEELEFMGYKTRAISLSAKDLGGDHVRRRYWLFAYADNEGKLLRGLHAKMARLPEFQNSIWAGYIGESRVSDGLATRMERCKGTGNGQVPIVAVTAFRILVNESVEMINI